MLEGTLAVKFAAITIEGRDAPDFLHRLTTAHVKALPAGNSVPTCFLTPQGRFESYFWLARLSETRFVAAIDQEEAPDALAALEAIIDRYTFAEKIAVRPLTLPHAFLQFGPPKTLGVTEAPEEIRMPLPPSAYGQPSTLILRNAPLESDLSPDWVEKARIEALSPKNGREITPETSPVEVGAAQAVAPNKGCYPGQEVIEKVIALGSPARRLVRIRGSTPTPIPGVSLLDEASATVGKITSAVTDGDHYVALALVRKTHAREGLEVRTDAGSSGRIDAVAPYQN